MAIRFECEQCGSVLKIKDDLAGKPGKCPKCKTAFTVPEPDDGPDDSTSLDEPEEESEIKSSVAKTTSSASDDFDVDDFLSADLDLDSKAKSKSPAKSRTPLKDIDEDALLSDEPAEKPKRNRNASSASLDDEEEAEDEVFQIRRNDPSKASTSKRTPPPKEIDEEKPSPVHSRSAPGTNSAGTAANMASDLLAKTGKKGKKSAWNEAADERKRESEYDYTDLKNHLFKKIAPLAVGGLVGCWLLYTMMSSAMGGKSYLPELGQVTGKVTLAGKPLANVTVLFHPVQSSTQKVDKKKRASSSGGTTDAAGHYELKYGDAKGAAIGECLIGIEAPSRSDIPAKFMGQKLTVTKTVKPGRQVIDLELSE